MKRFVAVGLLSVAALLLITLLSQAQSRNEAASTPRPQWGDYGLALANAQGNTPQQNAKIIATSDGNFAVVWEDNRQGYTDVFAQKLDRAGNRLWGEVKLMTCANPKESGNQNNPQLIDDGSGGIIVAWQGYCGGSADIFAQRVSAQGTSLWGEAAVNVCNAAAGQFSPQLVSDGAGGAIITWHDYRSGAGEDLFAQRLDTDGKALWEKNGVAVCTAAGTQWYPTICSDGQGGAILAWADGRISSADNNIFAQRLDPAGNPLWGKDGTAISSAQQNQERPVIIRVEDGTVIAWNDSRAGNIDIYLQKIDLTGKALWEKDGVAAVTAPYSQQNPKLAPDGKGGAVVAWTDNQEDEAALYAQRLSSNGRIVWEENGRLIAKSVMNQANQEIVRLPTAEWVIVWEGLGKGLPLLSAQKLNGSGIALWPTGGLRLAAGDRQQEKPAAAIAPNGDTMVVWQDKRNGNYDLYAQKITPDGVIGWGEAGLVVCNTPGSVLHQNANLIEAGNDGVIVVFEDARSGFINIYVQKIARDGSLLWGKTGLAVAKIKADQSNAQLVSDGAGGALICWEDQRNPDFTMIYAQHIAATGKKVWDGGSRPLTKINTKQTDPVMAADGAGGAIIAWVDERNPLSLRDLYGQRVSGQGTLLWSANGLRICDENGDQVDPAMVSDNSGGTFLAWTDSRRGERNPDIYIQRLGVNGNLLWPKEGVIICGAPDIQKSPQIIRDQEGGVIVVWTDKGGGSYDLYAQRINQQGKVLWITDGIPLNQSARTQQNPILSDNQVIIWEDYRLGNWDIFANAFTGQGKVLWGEEGVSVVSVPLTQYAPQVISWKTKEVVIAWEDYRSGKQYEIFMQKLNSDGQPAWQHNGYAVITADGARAPKLVALPADGSFVVVWEDYTTGGKALFAQKFLTD